MNTLPQINLNSRYVRAPLNAVLSLFVHPISQHKIRAVSNFAKEAAPYLDADQIPPWLGGTSKSPAFELDERKLPKGGEEVSRWLGWI